MTSVGERIREARDAAKMSDELLAKLACVELEAVRAAEAGGDALSAAEVDRIAQVFGVRRRDFLRTGAAHAPLTLLLRSSHDDGVEAEVARELSSGLGEFLRVVSDVAELEAALGRPKVTLPRPPRLHRPRGEHAGEQLARSVRAHLGLGDAKRISSMRRLVDELGVRVIWVTEAQLDRRIDGASTLTPRPAILVNLLDLERFPWRARMTLAHELCHLLYDYKRARPALVSPQVVKWGSIAEIEERARAFSACLLAPTTGVRALVDGLDPASDEAVRRVGERFGVGQTVAINRLQHTFRLSAETRLQMQRRSVVYEADFSGDLVEPHEVGFRNGVLEALVREALRSKKMSVVNARQLLGLRASEPLPFEELPLERRAPVVADGEDIRRKAERLLHEKWPGLMATHAERRGNAWQVQVVEGGIGRRAVLCGHLVLSASGELLESRLQLDSTRSDASSA